MTDPPPLLDPESPWPVPTGTLGRTHGTDATGPGETKPATAWTYDHDAGLAAPPVVSRDGRVVLLDADDRLSLLSAEGTPAWTVPLGVEPVPAFDSSAVWRRDGRTLVSASHDGGVALVEPGVGVVDDVGFDPPARFLALRADGAVAWSREGFALVDDRGRVVAEHRFVWRSDDVAAPTVGPDGAVYYLDNREYSPSWDSEDQFLEVARVALAGGADREAIYWTHAFHTDALGALCATDAALFWVLDGRRVGYRRFDDAGCGGTDEVETTAEAEATDAGSETTEAGSGATDGVETTAEAEATDAGSGATAEAEATDAGSEATDAGRETTEARAGVTEVDADAVPGGRTPDRILCATGETALLQARDDGAPVYRLDVGAGLSRWSSEGATVDGATVDGAPEAPVDAAIVDRRDRVYLLADGHLHGASLDGHLAWTTPADGEWLAAAGDGRLLVADPDGWVTCFARSA